MASLKLVNKTKNVEVAGFVRVADSFFARAIGLMGKKSLPAGEALWFKGAFLMPANSIQTHFMRFAIDVVFTDRSLVVKEIVRDLKPWRMTKPVRGAVDCFELAAGSLARTKIEIGDQLHVGN
ncbi:MAG: DUF192 domain-containing protein [Bdellovibrionota bacterium]